MGGGGSGVWLQAGEQVAVGGEGKGTGWREVTLSLKVLCSRIVDSWKGFE